MTYMVSYMHKFVNEDVNYSNIIWVNAFTMGAQGFFMILGGILQEKCGPKITCLIGCSVMR